MTIELITGKALTPHVDSADDGAYHARTMGAGTYVLHGCACTMVDANTAHIAPGELLVEGRHVRVMGTGEDVTVENGTQGQKRHDLVVVRYELGEEDVEMASLAVVKGVPTSVGLPNDPSCAAGSILAGDPLAEHPLYRVPLDGVSVGEPEPLFEPWEPLAVACERIDEKLLEVVPGTRGGTGGGSLFRGMANLVNSVPENATAPSDASRFLMPTSDQSVVWRSAANVWTWIASKVRSTFGFGSTNVLGVANGGTGAYDERGAANVLKLQSIARGTAIAASADLDAYKTPGNYVSSSADVSKTLKHTPVTANGFRMTVWQTLGTNSGGSVVGQDVLVWTTGRRYWRSWIEASGWSAWQILPTASVPVGATAAQEAAAFRSALGIDADELLVQSIARGTSIPKNANLDAFRTPGNYVSVSGDVSSTIANSPISNSGFRLTVMATLGTVSNNSVIGQRVVNWVTGSTYWRAWDSSSGWHGWYVAPFALQSKAPWYYDEGSDTAGLGTKSNVTIGHSEKSTNVRGSLTFGTSGKPVKIVGNLSGKLSGLGSYGTNGTVFKRLWSGTLAVGGSVTVAGLSNYNIIMCTPANEATALIGARQTTGGTIIRCNGAYDDGGSSVHGSVQSMQASFTCDGDKVTLVGASSYYLLDGYSVRKSIGAIWGLI